MGPSRPELGGGPLRGKRGGTQPIWAPLTAPHRSDHFPFKTSPAVAQTADQGPKPTRTDPNPKPNTAGPEFSSPGGGLPRPSLRLWVGLARLSVRVPHACALAQRPSLLALSRTESPRPPCPSARSLSRRVCLRGRWAPASETTACPQRLEASTLAWKKCRHYCDRKTWESRAVCETLTLASPWTPKTGAGLACRRGHTPLKSPGTQPGCRGAQCGLHEATASGALGSGSPLGSRQAPLGSPRGDRSHVCSPWNGRN